MDSMHIVFVASRFRDGGVEQRINRRAAGMLRLGMRCTFLLGESGKGAAGESIPDGVAVEGFAGNPESLTGRLRELIRGRGSRPCAVIAFRATDYSNVVETVRRCSQTTGVFLISGAWISERLAARGLGKLRAWRLARRIRRSWSKTHGVLAISPEIAHDWRSLPGFPAARVHHVHPPVVGEDVDRLSQEVPEHPWARLPAAPLIIGVGRLVPDKRFQVLLEAFRLVRLQQPARLVLLGRGPQAEALRDAAEAMRIADDVCLPGFTPNPYAWMRAASMLVLPSLHEPFGLVLIEAAYTGTPFIAMADAKGPASIKRATGCGQLVAGTGARDIADAIEAQLACGDDPRALRDAVTRYESLSSAREHLEIIQRNMP